MTFDIAIIGGGIVGAATMYKIQKENPTLKLILIEKEDILADHQTGHNSGVIHSGLYYKPGSLKAKNCIQGRHELVAFAKEHNIAHDMCYTLSLVYGNSIHQRNGNQSDNTDGGLDLGDRTKQRITHYHHWH